MPPAAALPPVIEKPDWYDGARVMTLVGELHEPGNIAVWELTYLCSYASGVRDESADVRQVIAGSRARAISTLQELMSGFGVSVIWLIDVVVPMTVSEVRQLKEWNTEHGAQVKG